MSYAYRSIVISFGAGYWYFSVDGIVYRADTTRLAQEKIDELLKNII